LVDQVRSIVLSTSSGNLDYDDFDDDDDDEAAAPQTTVKLTRIEEIAQRLGTQVANDCDAYKELLPDLVSGVGRLFSFGIGLATGLQDPTARWDELRAAYASADSRKRNISVLGGFLRGVAISDNQLAEALLDRCVGDPLFVEDFPDLQCSVPIIPAGVDRLRAALENKGMDIQRFRRVAWGRNHLPIDNALFASLVRAVAAKPEGASVALEIVLFRFREEKEAKSDHAKEILDASRDILSAMEFESDMLICAES
jgi:hypothetical protein